MAYFVSSLLNKLYVGIKDYFTEISSLHLSPCIETDDERWEEMNNLTFLFEMLFLKKIIDAGEELEIATMDSTLLLGVESLF